MYPWLRFLGESIAWRSAPLPLDGVHVTRLTCWPWDIDPWGELNNGRTLTLFDLGRIPLAVRLGFVPVLRRNRWSMSVAGASVRYRRRVQAFHRFEMRSKLIGRDAKFLYILQTTWRGGDPLASLLVRMAVVGAAGIVPADRVMAEFGRPDWNPPLPQWVEAWIAADARRAWPPEI